MVGERMRYLCRLVSYFSAVSKRMGFIDFVILIIGSSAESGFRSWTTWNAASHVYFYCWGSKGECGPKQPRLTHLPYENGQSSSRKSKPVPGKICKFTQIIVRLW